MYAPRGVSCSLLHLVCRFPLLVVPVALAIFFLYPHYLPQKCLPEALVSFTFDDGFFSTYTKAFPILTKYGYTGTVFVITSCIGTTGYMNASQLLELQNQGWEIASHSHTHSFLTELSDKQLISEIKGSKSILESLGLRVYGFACPGGRYNEKIVSLISQYYLYHRTSWPAGLNQIPLQAPQDQYRLMSVSIEANTTLEEAKQWVLQAKKEKKWLIFIFHRIDESGEYNWSSQDFEELVKFVKSQGFQGISMSQFFS